MKRNYILTVILIFMSANMNAQTTDVVSELGYPYFMALNGNDLYIAELSEYKISKIDITSNSPTPIDVVTGLEGRPFGLALKGDYLYISEYSANKISKIDVRSNSPTAIDVVTGLDKPVGIAFRENELYIAENGAGKISKIEDINAESLIVMDVVTGLNRPTGLVLNGNELYLTQDQDGKVSKIDITANSPTVMDLVTGLTNPVGIALKGNDLYFTEPMNQAPTDKIYKIDITDNSPTLTQVITGVSGPRGLVFNEDALYIAESPAGKISKWDINTVYIKDANFEQALIDLYIDSDGVVNQSILRSDAENALEINARFPVRPDPADTDPSDGIDVLVNRFADPRVTITTKIEDLTGIEAFINLNLLALEYNALKSIDVSNNTQLKDLIIGGNSISTLDLAANALLEYLNCNLNPIASLDVSLNPNLRELSLDNLLITDIDLSNNPNLESFWASNMTNFNRVDFSSNPVLRNVLINESKLESLNLSNNTSLSYLAIRDNNLITHLDIRNGNNSNLSLDVVNTPSLTCINADGSGLPEINQGMVNSNKNFSIDCGDFVYIPDPNFEQALIDLDIDSDGVINQSILRSDAENTTELNVNFPMLPDGSPNQFADARVTITEKITNLAGIEAFINVTLLGVAYHELTTVDLSNNTKLDDLFLSDNLLTGIDISHNTLLTRFGVMRNPNIGVVDVSNNTLLKELFLENTGINTIDLTNNLDLWKIRLENNNLTDLDISTNSNLSEIRAQSNEISQINISHLSNLLSLNFSNNPIGSIDVSSNIALKQLYLNSTNITSLDVATNINLSVLYCQYNQLQELDVTQNTALTVLECEGNGLEELNVTQNPILRVLGFGPNNLTEIDVSQNLLLEGIWTNGNNLSTLNLDANSVLAVIGLSNNPYSYVSLKNGNNLNVQYIEAMNLPTLGCIEVDDANAASYLSANFSFVDESISFNEDCGTVYIPDSNFENYLETHNANGDLVALGDSTSMGDGVVNNLTLKSKVDTVTNLNVNDSNIARLQGIEAFINLETLFCQRNQLESLDVSKNLVLSVLECESNQFSTLDVSKNTALTVLGCANNFLTEIDVTKNLALTGLWCTNNLITSLNLDLNTEMNLYGLSDNPLEHLSIRNGNNHNIIYSVMQNLNLDCINVDDETADNSNLQASNIDSNITITFSEDCGDFVYIPDPNFEQSLIDIGFDSDGVVNTSILRSDAEAQTGQLDVSNKNISDLTGIEAFINLKDLRAQRNQISEINLSNNHALELLGIWENQLTALDLSSISNFKNLYADNNLISTITFSDSNLIERINLRNNPINNLDVSNYLNLIQIDIAHTNISSVDFSQNLDLSEFYVNGLGLETLDVSKNASLTGLDASENNFKSIDLSNNPELAYITITNCSFLTNLDLRNGNNASVQYFNVANTASLTCINTDALISQPMTDSGKTFSEACGDFVYVNDINQTDDIYTTAVGSDTNLGTKHAPVATITHALSIANEGSIIYVDSGAFPEQVIIDKGITIIGAGQDLTSFVPPATTLVPAPGPFTEIGLFETIQGIGDVHISNLSINSSNNASQNIIIQSGGSVKNCKLLNGQQGIFFRIGSDIKTAVIENNYIEPTGIGINCQGSGLTVNILNNTITRASGFFSGIFAGLDFGPLPQLTIINNTLNNYFGTGMLVNSDNGTYNNNSIVGTGTFAIQQFSGNPSNATCNWYGVADAASVAAKIDGDINYQPWLVVGTDDDPGLGFQPLPGVCNGTVPVIILDDANAIDCFGSNNGTINISMTGGLAPFTFVWTKDGDAVFNSANEDLTDLAPGSYNLLLIDANGSTASLNNVNITEPPLLTASIINNSTACSNNATVTAGGGTTGYTYLWSNGDITNTINNVPVGTYDVMVTDANGCTTIASIDLTVGEAFNPSAAATDVSCFGDSNGIIEVTNANGTAPFEFSKDGITFSEPGEFPYSFNDLEAGTYEIAVRDANGCTGFVTKTVSQPEELTVTLVSIQSTCSGESTGSISVETAGGTGGLSYSWEGPEAYASSQRNISRLAVGEYSLTVTDNNGCTALLDAVVPTSNEIVVSETITNVLCRGTFTGAIDINVTGGSGSGFTYSWTGNITSTSEDISNLGSGTNYNVTITDIGSGCAVSESYIVTEPADNLSLATSKINADGCKGGTIIATASGGTSPYEYKLDNGNYQTSGEFTSLSSGSFTVWVKDSSGCTSSKVVAITDNGKDEWETNNSKNRAKLILINETINARIALANDTADWFKFTTPEGGGNYTVNFYHPLASFNVQLYPDSRNAAALATTSPSSNQYALTGNATYYVQITGGLSFDCYDLSIFPVTSAARSTSTKTDVMSFDEFSVKAWPNPSDSSFNIKLKSINGLDKVDINVFDVTNKLVHSNQFEPNQEYRFGGNLEGGIYFVKLSQADNVQSVKLVKY